MSEEFKVELLSKVDDEINSINVRTYKDLNPNPTTLVFNVDISACDESYRAFINALLNDNKKLAIHCSSVDWRNILSAKLSSLDDKEEIQELQELRRYIEAFPNGYKSYNSFKEDD